MIAEIWAAAENHWRVGGARPCVQVQYRRWFNLVAEHRAYYTAAVRCSVALLYGTTLHLVEQPIGGQRSPSQALIG